MGNSQARIVIEHIHPYRVVIYNEKGKEVGNCSAMSRFGAENLVRAMKEADPQLKHLTVTQENKR